METLAVNQTLTITPSIIEWIIDCFDEDPLSENEHDNGNLTYEYKDCEYWLDDGDKSENNIPDVDCYVNFNATWHGTKQNMKKGGGKLNIHLKSGDEPIIIFCT